MASANEKPGKDLKDLKKKLTQAKAMAAKDSLPAQATAKGKPGDRIPKQAIMDIPHKYDHPEPGRNGSPQPSQKTSVIIKQTPAPEVKIYGQTTPRKYTTGMKASDKIAKWAGSWAFITGFFVFLIIWMLINLYIISAKWDPYPFILLNLVLSCLAAIQAPVILMSQNRAADRDRVKAQRDYAVNRKAEREIETITKDLDYIKKKITEIGIKLR